MEFITLETVMLHPWSENWQTYTQTDIDLLKEKLEKKDQLEPLIVTPDENADTFTVLSGNKRIVAYQQLGVERVWVWIVTFDQKEDGLWYATLNGNQQKERYTTKADGMRDYNLLKNEHYGDMDWDKFANSSHTYNLDWSKYMMGSKPKRISTKLNEFLMVDKMTPKKDEELECPSCQLVALKSDFKRPTV